jgi:hypothetical protein
MGGTRFWIAALAFALAAVVCGATVIEAVRIEEVANGPEEPASEDRLARVEADRSGEAEAEAETPSEPLDPSEVVSAGRPGGSVFQGHGYPEVSHEEILAAVNQDLFQPDRTPPLERYLLPGQRPASEQSSGREERIRWPDLRVVGTAISGDLALAMVQPDDSLPFAVLEGETVEGYTVAVVSEEFVTLAMGDAQFTYPVTEPQEGASSRDRQSIEEQIRARGNISAEQARDLAQRFQTMMRRGQGGRGGGEGMSLGFFEAPVMIRPGGGTSGGEVAIRRRGGTGGGGGGTLP